MTHDADTRKLLDLIRPMRACMMVTFQSGEPHSRPMFTLGAESDSYDGHLWFFTSIDSAKVSELRFDGRVLLTYAAPDTNNYVSITGDAEVVNDREKVKQLWNIHAKAWFPEGPADPSLALIRLTPHQAEYWEGPSKVAYLASLARALITSERIDPTGNHAIVAMNP